MKTMTAAALALALGLAPAHAADLAAGEATYRENCVACHGRAGRGMASFPSIRGRDADYISGRLTTYRAGERVGPNSLLMIPIAMELTDEEIANLAAFVSSNFR